MAQNNQNSVQHGLNAAQANAESEQDQQQLEALSAQLQQNAGQANASEQEDSLNG